MRIGRSFGTLLIGSLLCVGVGACGGASDKATRADHASSSVSTRKTPLVRDVDEDYDDSSGAHYDLDDNAIRYYGHAASGADATAVAALVKNYYADAAAGDGAAACRLIFPVLAESLPEQYASSSGGESKYGRTCRSVASKLFRVQHRLYVERNASLRITGVRVEGVHGYALLSFHGIPDEHLHLRREAAGWTLHQLLDEGLP